MKRLIIRQFDETEDMFQIEWLHHSHDTKVFYIGAGNSIVWKSSRVAPGGFIDIEASKLQMCIIADAITKREHLEFRRCAIRFDKKYAYLWNPRSSLMKAKISLAAANDLAHGIDLRLKEYSEWKDIPEYADLIPMSEFVGECRSQMFVDYDGYGEFVYDSKIPIGEFKARPSDIRVGAYDRRYTHVAWYNR